MTETVGIVGLGQMGAPMSKHLLDSGFHVVGYDVDASARDELAARGGHPETNSKRVAQRASTIITSLPSAAALHEVLSSETGLLAGGERPGLVIVETSTLDLDTKHEARATAERAGALLLDCPLSGTSAQAENKDLVVYASGDSVRIDALEPVFSGFSRAHFNLGEFGRGSIMKYLANHLVAIHNVAAAEAFVLGMKAGIDPDTIYKVITSGAGTSRMFEVRGPMMVAGEYDEGGIASSVFSKDLEIINAFAKSVQAPMPLFAASSQIYTSGLAQGYGDADTASVCAVLEQMANHLRDEPSATDEP